jgi:putative transposase
MVSDLAEGPYAGEETGETDLFRELFDSLKHGEVIVADRYFCGWFMLALLRELGIHFMVRMHQLRHYDFRRGQKLGNRDHIVSWKKPVRPKWMSPEVYASLPAEMQVRETHVSVGIPGFRVDSLVAVSSFLDDDLVEATDIADLYHQRWRAELHLREIKSYMELDVLRAVTPEMVRQELQMGMLAYNLVRQSMLQSAIVAGKRPNQLSFTAALQVLTTTWLIAAIPPGCTISTAALATLRLISTALHLVGNRPDRIEPRKIKLRHSADEYLTIPRKQAIANLLKGLVS